MKQQTIIWRNDDVSLATNSKEKLKLFKDVHALFEKYKVKHTVSLIAKEIDKAKALVKFIKDNKIEVQVHAWNHQHYIDNIEQAKEDLPKAVEMIKKVFGKKPTIFYPPWNESSIELEEVAKENGLTVSNKKISLSQYLKGVQGEVVNFHYWAPECEQLEEALQKYTEK